MAHYRTLTVDDKEYKYNIGKRFVAIRSDNLSKDVLREDIGILYCDYIVTTPKMVADYIRGVKGKMEDYFPSCSCENVSKHLSVNPFQSEIYNRKIYIVICDDCYTRLQEDI